MNYSFDHIDPQEVLRRLQARLDKLEYLQKRGIEEAEASEELLEELTAPLSPGFDEFVERAEAMRNPRHLPPGTRFAWLKRLLLRVIRVYSAGQSEFNDAALQSMREAAETIRRQGDALNHMRLKQRTADERQDAVVRELEGSFVELRRSIESILAGHCALEAATVADRADAEKTRADAEKTRVALNRAKEELERLRAWVRNELPDSVWPPELGVEPVPALEQAAGARLSYEDYLEFERLFRGSEEDIQRRVRPYVDLYTGIVRENGGTLSGKAIVDVGCGRGELLEALRGAGLTARGVEANPKMVELCRQKGLEAEAADALRWIESVADKSLAGLCLIQVIEHWPIRGAAVFLTLARRKLAPGGILVVETINPESVWAMRWYRLDWTHRSPYPAALTEFLMKRAGFSAVEIRPVSPVEPWRGLAHVGDANLDTNFDKVNNVLFAHQDYAAIGRVAAHESL